MCKGLQWHYLYNAIYINLYQLIFGFEYFQVQSDFKLIAFKLGQILIQISKSCCNRNVIIYYQNIPNSNRPSKLLFQLNMKEEKQINKTIQKYRIQSIVEVKPNNISIMRAVNTITGQHFIIKKAAITTSESLQKVSKSNQSNETRQSNTQSGLLYNEVNCIKQLNIPRILKCFQMIKTKRSLYLVYENYPEMNLERYIKQRAPAPALKIRFAKIICQFMQQVHKKKYLYITLCPACIFVISGSSLNPSSYQLRFVGFEYARKIKQPSKVIQVDNTVIHQNPFIAPEVLEQGTASQNSDIYSVGKVFQLLGISNMKGKPDQKSINQTLCEMINANPKNRPSLSKVCECLKQKQLETPLFDHKILQIQPSINRNKFDTTSTSSKQKSIIAKNMQKKNIEEEERRLKKIIKIRTLVIYLHDLANFSLKQKNKALFYMLLKKSVIVRANLIHQLKKMLCLHTGEHYSHLNNIKQTLSEQQNNSLNLLTKVQQNLKNQQNSINILSIKSELENRNELNEQFIEELICQFVKKKKKEIKPFHSILDEKQRSKLIYLCGLTEKLVYGSFQKFFDQVVDDSQIELHRQKYFGYLKTASTKQICQRLQKILKQRQLAK